MPLPLWYKIQDGCWNCQHVFRHTDFEEGSDYYCCEDGTKRPLCDSHLLGEDHYSFLKTHGFPKDTPAEIISLNTVNYKISGISGQKNILLVMRGFVPRMRNVPVAQLVKCRFLKSRTRSNFRQGGRKLSVGSLDGRAPLELT